MTPEQNARLRALVDAAQTADHEWCEGPINDYTSGLLEAAEQAVCVYVEEMLAEKAAETLALQSHTETTRQIVALLPDCLKYSDGAEELLQTMKEIKEFYEAKENYKPEPRPEPVSKRVKISKTIERPPMIIFDDDD